MSQYNSRIDLESIFIITSLIIYLYSIQDAILDPVIIHQKLHLYGIL